MRCPGPLCCCSPVCPLGLLCCACGVVGDLPPAHPCARSVLCFACTVSWATWLLCTGVPARCVVLRVRCPGRPGSCSPVCPLGVLRCVCSVLGHLAPVHRCARSVCCVACAVSWATWLLFTGVPARRVRPCVRCPGPLGSCSPVCPLGGLCRACGVLGPLAPVWPCARSVCCVVCAVSWAAWLLFTGVLALCAVLLVAPRVLLCGAWLRGPHSSIRTAAVRSRQGLGTPRARTRPSVRRLFVAGRDWVPSGRALIHPDGGWCCLATVSCRGSLRVVRALRVCGSRRPLLPGTCPCALVVASRVPLWRASWPRVVRRASSGRSLFFLVSPLFFPLRPLCLLLSLVFGPGFPGPWRFVLFVFLALRFLALRALPLSFCFLAIGLSPVVAPPPSLSLVLPFLVVLCFFFLFPPLRAPLVSGPLCFPAPGALGLGAALCLLCSAHRALCFFYAPCLSVLGALPPVLCLLVGRWLFPGGCCPPPPLLCLAVFVVPARCLGVFFPLFLCASVASGFLWFPAPGALGLGAVFCLFFSASRCPALRVLSLLSGGCCPPPPPSPFVSRGFHCSCWVPWGFCFLLPLCAPVVSGFLWFPALGALGLGAVRCLLCWPSASWLSVRPHLLRAFRLAVGCSRVIAAPPPLCVSRFSSLPLGAVCRVLCCAVCPWVRCCAALLRVVPPGVVLSCAVLLCCARLVPLLVAPCLLALPVALGPCALRRCVLRCSPRCVLSAVCFFSWRGGACCCSPLCCVLYCAFPVLSALCGAVVRCAGALALCCSCGACCCWRLVLWCAAVCRAVSFGMLWCGAGSDCPWLSAGGVFRCRCPCLAACSASLWLVWFAVVPCFPVSCSVVLCCRVVLCCCALLLCCRAVGACFALLWPVVLCFVVLLVACAFFCPLVVSACCDALSLVLCAPCLLRSVRCGALLCWLWCPASPCRVLWRCAVVWCCAVVLCCCFAVLFVGATCCRSDGSYRPCKNFSWFNVTGTSIFSKLCSDVTAASSAWYTQVRNGTNALTE